MVIRIFLLPIILAALWAAADANTFYFQVEPQYSAASGQLLIVGPAGATGTVTGSSGFSKDFDLGHARRALIQLPIADTMGEVSIGLFGGVVQDKGFKLTSGATVSAYYLNQTNASADMATLIDADKLGTDYVVAGAGYLDQLSVQATQDNTAVTISHGSAKKSVALNAGQTYLITDYNGFTGFRVSADKPIAVQSGNICDANHNRGCDHLVEQIPPIDALSTSYLLPLTPRVIYGDKLTGNVVRVVAVASDTEVTLNGVTVAHLGNGEYYEGLLREAAQITPPTRRWWSNT